MRYPCRVWCRKHSSGVPGRRRKIPGWFRIEDAMIGQYIRAAMGEARYEILEDGSFYGEIPALKGVWANAGGLEETREELLEVLEEWIVLRLSRNLPIPAIGGAAWSPPWGGSMHGSKALA